MNKNILLQQLNYNEQAIILDIIMQDSSLKETFSEQKNIISRILNSSYIGLIKKDVTTIGYIMLVYNSENNTHEVDMGIISTYQNQGYGTKALHHLGQIIDKEQVHVTFQIKKENIGANRIVKNNNFVLRKEDKNHFYYSN